MYHGDSPGKKVARLLMWERLLEVSRQNKLTGPILGFASREAGDYAVASAFGAAKRLVLVERDKGEYETAKLRRPEADIRLADVRDVAHLIRPSCAILDFCTPIASELVSVCEGVLPCLPYGGVFCVGVMRAREAPGVELPSLEIEGGLSRAFALPAILAKGLSRTFHKRCLVLDSVLDYNSSGEGKIGVPMSYLTYIVRRTPKPPKYTGEEYRKVVVKDVSTVARELRGSGLRVELALNL